jgi:hypothetical protein
MNKKELMWRQFPKPSLAIKISASGTLFFTLEIFGAFFYV